MCTDNDFSTEGETARRAGYILGFLICMLSHAFLVVAVLVVVLFIGIIVLLKPLITLQWFHLET